MNEPLVIHPIGVVRSRIKKPVLTAGEDGIELSIRIRKMREQHEAHKALISELVLNAEMEDRLDGVEGFSHILVLYWSHLIGPNSREITRVHPMGWKELPVQGVFATCSPARPNPVLVSAVRLLGREGTVLKVQGLDAVDGSPVVDIKPYVLNYYGIEEPEVPEWMKRIRKALERGGRGLNPCDGKSADDPGTFA